MADPNVVNYINAALGRGDSREKIRADFISNGWTEEAIDSVFIEMFGGEKPAANAERKRGHKFLIFILVIAVLALISFGGYYAYNKGYINLSMLSSIKTMLPVQTAAKTQQQPEAQANMSGLNESGVVEGGAENISSAISNETEEEVKEEQIQFTQLANPCKNITICTEVARGYGGSPSLVWTGGLYGIAWSSNHGSMSRLYFARVSSQGSKAGSEAMLLEKEGSSKKPSAAWTGKEYGIAWPVGNVLYLIKAGSNGEFISEKEIARSAGLIEKTALVWNGSEYGVVFSDTSLKVYLERIDENGNALLDKTDAGLKSSAGPSIAWAESEYGISWLENSVPARKVYLLRIDPSGEKISTISIKDDYWFCNGTSLSWADSRYGVAYSCLQNNKMEDSKHEEEVYYMKVHSTGGNAELIELDQGMVQISDSKASSRNPAIVLNEKTYGAAWEDDRSGNYDIYFNRLNSYTGTKMEDSIQITGSPAESLDPSLVWADSEFGIAWTENEGNRSDIYFAKVSQK